MFEFPENCKLLNIHFFCCYFLKKAVSLKNLDIYKLTFIKIINLIILMCPQQNSNIVYATDTVYATKTLKNKIPS